MKDAPMASVRTRTWGPTHPSAAFLIKCAKEKEKLRTSLQKQLQEHMLCMLEECVFSDTLISINSGKAYHAENPSLQSQHLDLPHISYAHKSLLKVRVPAFYDHLCRHEEINLGVTSYNCFLEEPQLKQFLRNVYTDDDIRKHECEALRNSKTHEEVIRQRKAHFHEKQLVNKRIVDVDEFEKESVNSSCTENFVTPKTSPLTPEKSIDVPDMFHPVQKKSSRVSDNLPKLPLKNANSTTRSSMQNAHNGGEVIPPSETPNTGEISEGYVSELDNTFDEDIKLEASFGLPATGDASSNSLTFKSETNIASVNNEVKTSFNIENSYTPEIADNFPSPLGSDDASACKKTASDLSDSSNAEMTTSSSMVRSNTFDLNRQACLEDYIDNNSLWENEDSSDQNVDKSFTNSPDVQSYLNEKEIPKVSELETCGSFFLHNPSLKPNIINSSYAKDMPLMAAQDSSENVTPSGTHFRRLDGSMSDSGFLSHSTFSMLSDVGIPGSIASSLILSSDGGILSPSCTSSQSNTQDSEASKRLSGSMFPFYIDINKLPSEQTVSDKEEKPKSTSSSVYMFIDADKPEAEHTRKSQSFDDKKLCSEYDDFSEKRNLGGRYPVTHSSSYGDSSTQKSFTKSEPCYMYIDLDSIESNTGKERKDPSTKAVPSSVSMFIDLNDDLSKIADSNQGSPYHTRDENTNINRVSDKKDYKLADKYFVLGAETQKQMDSNFVNSGRRVSDLNIHSHPYVQLEERSSSALDYRSFRRKNKSGKNDILYTNNSNIAMYTKSDNLSHSIENFFSEAKPARRSHSTLPANFKAKWMDDPNYVKSLDAKIISYTKKLCEVQSGNLFNTSLENDEKALANVVKSSENKERTVKEQEVEKANSLNRETELLPMSPILRRKTVNKEPPKSPVPIVVKASTRPQDIDAMTFPRPDKKESPKLSRKLSQEDNFSESLCKHSSPSRRLSEEPKSSNESLKLGSECLSECCDLNVKDKSFPDAMSRSGSSVMTVSGGDTSSSGKHTPFDASKERLLQSSPSWSLSCDFEDDSETIYSEVSDVSSSLGGIASLERRWRERQSNDADPRDMHNVYRILEACSKLGEDLLRMFLEGIDTDIIIEVEGKQIKAHRCILSARCKYFSAMLKGRWSENTDKIINLHGFSYSAVHFALCHIYSGALSLPKDINIAELALLADMLNLDSLTDVIVFHLKMDYCHFFHRPCNQCTLGVVECLPLAASCGLNELRDKCIFWLGKYFTRTWPNKTFASLSEEFRDQCYNCTLSHVSINSVIEMIMNCDRLLTTLPHVKWAEPIFGMVTRLLQDCIHYLAQNFNQILCCEGFLSLGKGQSWNVTALEDDIIAAIELMSPDVACKSYVKLNQILPLAEPDGGLDSGEFTQNFVDLLHKINRHCERYLIHNANRVVHCKSWAYLSPDVQKKIKDAAVIVFEFEKPTAPPPRLSSLQRKMKKFGEIDDASYPERSTYPRRSKTAPPGKFFQDQFSERSANKKEDRICPQRRELEIMMKKIVSPIKEEVNNHILESACREVAIEAISSFKKGGLGEKEGDTDQPLGKDLPDSQKKLIDTQLSQGSFQEDSVESTCAEDGNSEDNRSTAHCSDNPDSLEVNEETSCDSKDDLDASISVEDASYPEKVDVVAPPPPPDKAVDGNRPQKEEDKTIISKIKGTHPAPSLVPKSSTIIARENKVPILNPALPRLKKPCSQSYCDTSSVPKTPGKSFVPLTKTPQSTQETQTLTPPKNHNKDLVAEIDADSRMVNHCLQEAEMLEQELSRKLQRQHQAVSTSNISHYVSSSPVRAVPSQLRTSTRTPRNAVQKSLSASHVKPTSTRKRSPGSHSITKPLTPSPSSPQVPRQMRGGENIKDHKMVNKKTSQKSSISTSQRSYRSMESITTIGHSRQQSVTSVASTKRVSARSRSSAIPSSQDGRTVSSTSR